jgi:hypothetical protein
MGSYKTSDLWLAGYLIALGNALIGVDRSNPRRTAFILARPPTAEEQAGFDSGDGRAPIGLLMGAIRRLKRALYDGMPGGGRYE